MWSLANPIVLLLLPVPYLIARYRRLALPEGGAMRVPESVAVHLRSLDSGQLRQTALRLLPWLVWTALIVAIAGPQVITPAPVLLASGRDVVLALDLSGSMDEDDFELDGAPARRIDVVKQIAAEFVRGRGGDRVGVVIFSEDAYFAAPPTHDVEAAARAIEEAQIGISGRSTSISQGLGLALKRLADSPAHTRVVILLSDGINTAGAVTPIDAASYAGTLGVLVHTIALGTHDTSEAVDSRNAVDADTLKRIAEASGGTAFRVRTTADLAAVAKSLEEMEPSSSDGRVVHVAKEFWTYPAGAAFCASLLLLLVAARRA